MTYEYLLDAFLNHGNLSQSGRDNDSLLFHLWRMKQYGIKFDLLPFFQDIMRLFDALNLYLNGQVPSETNSVNKRTAIDRNLGYAINSIISECLGFSLNHWSENHYDLDFARKVGQITFIISYAWDCILAGDIDDLTDEILSSQFHDIDEQYWFPKATKKEKS